MATTSRKHAHPLRTLILLALVIAALFGVMAWNNIWTPKLGLDLRGGSTITLTASNVSGTGGVDAKSLELARTIIQQRVDSIGVGESEVTTSGDRQIVVSVPNVQQDELVQMVGKTAQLYFRQVFKQEASTGTTATAQPTATASAEEPTATAEPTATEQATAT
ncbi:MAG: protein translocase subunit SecD, partial [Propionicimonas sp.]